MPKSVSLGKSGKALRSLLNKSEKRIMKAADTAIRKSLVKTWGNIIKMTPVDTGRARNNWFIGMSPGNELVGKGNKGAQYVANNLPEEILGRKVYFYNNLPYINKLEYGGYPKNPERGTRRRDGSYEIRSQNGYSKQAPKGMVRVSLARWKYTLRDQFKKEMNKA